VAGPARRTTFGIFYGWWRGDPLPAIEQPAGLTIERPADDRPLPLARGLDPDTVATERAAGHRLYIATIDGEVAGWGWVATQVATIGELGVRMRLAPDERYLWGFETLPEWRGRGIYTALLGAILRDDQTASRFWIGHNAGNTPSARGILAAGFTPVGEAYEDANGALHYARYGDDERARAAETLLGMPA
jgi:GNAT superfamily N-acetyltransferase